MADSKITSLTEKTSLDGSEEFVINDSGSDKKVGLDYFMLALPHKISGYKSGKYYAPVGTTANKIAVTRAKDRIDYVKTIIPIPTTFTGASVHVTTAGTSTSVIRIGIYDDSDDGEPGSLVSDWGTVDATTTGVKTITISEALYGTYWLASAWQGTGTGLALSCNLMATSPGDGYRAEPAQATGQSSTLHRIYEESVSGAFPSSATPVYADDGNGPQTVWLSL